MRHYNYESLKNRMNNSIPFYKDDAIARINVIANKFGSETVHGLSPEETDELVALAEAKGMEYPAPVDPLPDGVEQETRLNDTETAINSMIGGEADAQK